MINKSQKTNYLIYTIFIISWFPVKGLFQPVLYVFPLIVLLLGLLFGTVYITKKAFVNAAIISVFFVIYGILINDLENFINVLVGILFLAPIYILVFRFRKIDQNTIVSLINTICIVSIVELVIGMVQLIQYQGFTLVFTSHGWDRVLGTTMARSSHIFSIKMLFQGLLVTSLYSQIIKIKPNLKPLYILGILSSFIGALISSYLIGLILLILGMIFIFSYTRFVSIIKIIFSRKLNFKKSYSIISRGFIILSIFSLSSFAYIKTQPDNFNS